MKKDSLSPTMQACLDFAVAGGGRLYRWKGGFWVNEPMPEGWSYPTNPAPARYYGSNTAYALYQRGCLAIIERLPRGDAKTMEVVQK